MEVRAKSLCGLAYTVRGLGWMQSCLRVGRRPHQSLSRTRSILHPVSGGRRIRIQHCVAIEVGRAVRDPYPTKGD